MPLFDVPGWSIPADPVAEPSSSTSKKRKRPGDTGSRLLSTEINFDKLVNKLKGKSGNDETRAPSKKRKPPKGGSKEEKRKVISHPRQLMSKEKALAIASSSSLHASKKTRFEHSASPSPDSSPPAKRLKVSTSVENLTDLQKNMKQSLDGARFRCAIRFVASAFC